MTWFQRLSTHCGRFRQQLAPHFDVTRRSACSRFTACSPLKTSMAICARTAAFGLALSTVSVAFAEHEASIVSKFHAYKKDASDIPNYSNYLELLQKYPKSLGPVGDASKGEIQIILDPVEMARISKATGREVGIVKQDQYWTWLNDAIMTKKADGTIHEGVYGRLLWNSSFDGPVGAAVLIVLPDGRYALVDNYRHATRQREMELIRGKRDEKTGEPVTQTVLREALEEGGYVLSKPVELGEIATDTGLTNSVVPIFIAYVQKTEKANPEGSEAIFGMHAFTEEEIYERFRKRYVWIEKNGKLEKVKFRDSFLASALTLKRAHDGPKPEAQPISQR